MENTKSKIPKEVRTSVALFIAGAVFILSASLMPDCGIFINTIFSGIAGAIAILS